MVIKLYGKPLLSIDLTDPEYCPVDNNRELLDSLGDIVKELLRRVNTDG